MTLCVVAGLHAERRILDRALPGASAAGRLIVVLSGARPGRAASRLAPHLAARSLVLVSFGFAGGLAAPAAPGTLVIADHVVLPAGERIAADRTLSARLRAAVAGRSAAPVLAGGIAGADAPVLGPAAKRLLADRTDAAAVDMESHVVAVAARTRDLPFVVLRAVADAAATPVPRGAVAAVRDDGRIAPGVVAAYLVTHPKELGDFVRLGRAVGAAARSLRDAAGALAELLV